METFIKEFITIRITQLILKTNTTINAIMTSTFPSKINIILMSRAIAEYIIGFVFSYILIFSSI